VRSQLSYEGESVRGKIVREGKKGRTRLVSLLSVSVLLEDDGGDTLVLAVLVVGKVALSSGADGRMEEILGSKRQKGMSQASGERRSRRELSRLKEMDRRGRSGRSGRSGRGDDDSP
jgi:hypothetical protein